MAQYSERKTRKTVTAVTHWPEAWTAMCVSWVRSRLSSRDDPLCRHGWCEKLRYKNINGMFALSFSLCFRINKDRKSTAANCCRCQIPRSCENQPNDLGWLPMPAGWRTSWGYMLLCVVSGIVFSFSR